VNPLGGRKTNGAGWFSTHPSTQARIERLRSGEWRS
jgi:Zn-dependent protease with chaperone function